MMNAADIKIWKSMVEDAYNDCIGRSPSAESEAILAVDAYIERLYLNLWEASDKKYKWRGDDE